MAIRYYLMPLIGAGTHDDPRRPAYVTNPLAMQDYGPQNVVMVKADVSGAEHTAIVANADAIGTPLDISGNLTAGAVTQLTTYLEAVNVPMQWVTTALTYTQMLQTLRRLFILMERVDARLDWFLTGGITLDTLLSALTVAQRQKLSGAAQNLGLDISGIVLTMTIRQALKFVADEIGVA